MAVGIRFNLNNNLFLRDPQETKLGQNIIKESIILIDEIGFEAFNFKKVAKVIGCTEASVYRYFENKHLLLIFLISWYWEWVSYLIDVNTTNIEDPKKKLRITITNILDAAKENVATAYVNEPILHRLVIAESAKAYHTKLVDEENKKGFFLDYKALAKKIATNIKAINPKFPYPNTLASNLLEMTNNQLYFAEHLPSLTDIKINKGSYDEVRKMLEYFVFKLLEK